MARKLTDTIQLKLRLSEALRRRLERAADAHDLSMNSEIIRRLEESFRRDDTRAERLKERRELVSHLDGFLRHFVATQMSLTEAQKAELDRHLDESFRRQEQEEGSEK